MSRTKIEARLLLRQKEILDPRENLLAAENNNGKMEIVIWKNGNKVVKF